jgi:hypothetical protein
MNVQVTNRKTGEVETYMEDDYVEKRNHLLEIWQDSKNALETAKAKEMYLREIAVNFMANPAKVGRVDTVDLANGYKAKLKIPINYGFVKDSDGKLDKTRLDKALSKIEKDGGAGELIAERLVKWTPALSLTEYKLLTPKHLAIINEVLITSEGTPTLEIVEPKN